MQVVFGTGARLIGADGTFTNVEQENRFLLDWEENVADRCSHLDKEVLSFVLEVATLHLDDRDASYLLTVGKTAKCLAKTPGQLSATLHRLTEQGLLKLVGKMTAGEGVPVNCQLLPTVAAMKTLPAFQTASNEEIEEELATLAGDECINRLRK